MSSGLRFRLGLGLVVLVSTMFATVQAQDRVIEMKERRMRQ